MNTRTALLGVFISAVIILITVPGAAVAGSSMASEDCGMTPISQHTPATTCCTSGNCLELCCSVPDTPGDKAIVTSLPVPAKDFVILSSKTDESIEITSSFDKLPRQDSVPPLSSYPYGEYHCRNSLDSEESFHI